MRILYVTNYQGANLVHARRIARNRALGASTKVELIAVALAGRGHDVTILSAGTVAERSGRWFGGFASRIDGSQVTVNYMPAWDLPILNRVVGAIGVRRWIRDHRGWDAAVVYNLAMEHVIAAEQIARLGVPVVFEYEDDATATLAGGAGANPRAEAAVQRAKQVARGAITVNEELRRQLGFANSEVVEGVVPDDVFHPASRTYPGRGEELRILYSGGLTRAKGIELLLEAAGRLEVPYRLTVTGAGPCASTVTEAARRNTRIEFLGEVPRERLMQELARAHICVNPHRTGGGQVGTLFPFKVAEYVACGAVVISSPLGEVPTALADGILFYQKDEVSALAAALAQGAERYREWSERASHARDFVRDQLSTTAIGAKVERVLNRARAVS